MCGFCACIWTGIFSLQPNRGFLLLINNVVFNVSKIFYTIAPEKGYFAHGLKIKNCWICLPRNASLQLYVPVIPLCNYDWKIKLLDHLTDHDAFNHLFILLLNTKGIIKGQHEKIDPFFWKILVKFDSRVIPRWSASHGSWASKEEHSLAVF